MSNNIFLGFLLSAKGNPLHEGEAVTGASATCAAIGSPPKLTRERGGSGVISPRRRYFLNLCLNI